MGPATHRKEVHEMEQTVEPQVVETQAADDSMVIEETEFIPALLQDC